MPEAIRVRASRTHAALVAAGLAAMVAGPLAARAGESPHGLSFDPPYEFALEGHSLLAPVLAASGDRLYALLRSRPTGAPSFTDGAHLFRSEDEGSSFETPRDLKALIAGAAHIQATALAAAGSNLYVIALDRQSGDESLHYSLWLLRSTDHGQTFEAAQLIDEGPQINIPFNVSGSGDHLFFQYTKVVPDEEDQPTGKRVLVESANAGQSLSISEYDTGEGPLLGGLVQTDGSALVHCHPGLDVVPFPIVCERNDGSGSGGVGTATAFRDMQMQGEDVWVRWARDESIRVSHSADGGRSFAPAAEVDFLHSLLTGHGRHVHTVRNGFVGSIQVQSSLDGGARFDVPSSIPDTAGASVTGVASNADHLFVGWQSSAPVRPFLSRGLVARMTARLSVEPSDVEDGELLTVRVEVFNTSDGVLSDIRPEVTIAAGDESAAAELFGEADTAPRTLAPGKSTAFELAYQATGQGALEVSAQVTAQDEDGMELTAAATAQCPVPAANAAGEGNAAAEPASCSPDSVAVLVTAPDLVLLLDVSDVLVADGDSLSIGGVIGNRSEKDAFTDVDVTVELVAIDAAGNATGEVVSTDPAPLHFGSIAALDAAPVSMTIQATLMEADAGAGRLEVRVEVQATNAGGERVRATIGCEDTTPAPAGSGQPGCDRETGRIVLGVGGDCIAITDESPPVRSFTTDIPVKREGNVIVACGGGGTCTILDDVREYTERLTEVELPVTGQIKNVGQEVVLRAVIQLPEGRTESDIDELRWTIDGETIESYQDFSAYARGMEGVVFFRADGLATNRVVEKMPDQADWDRVWFFWKQTGRHRVRAELFFKDQAQPTSCTSTVEFDVERNTNRSDRQAEKFYSSCCEKAVGGGDADGRARVANLHDSLHMQDDAQVIFPGDSWINFHRVILNAFDAWREYFGYPVVGMWDASVPMPAAENGYHTDEPSRFTDAPMCEPTYAPAGSLCPLPPWFTRSGALDDENMPIVRPDEPLVQDGSCNNPDGSEVPPGQSIIDDFTTNVALGCVLAKTWHANIHALMSGAMATTFGSPFDPAFWRMHNYLSGAQIGGGPGVPGALHADGGVSSTVGGGMGSTGGGDSVSGTVRGGPRVSGALRRGADADEDGGTVPVYLAWELEQAEGPPGISVALPRHDRPVTALPTVVVRFWKEVSGVDAADLVVDGSVATDIEVIDGYHVFTGFAPPGVGQVSIQLLPGQIEDGEGEAFAGYSWAVALEADTDGDGVADSVDNCPLTQNPTQANTDANHFFDTQYGGGHEPDHLASRKAAGSDAGAAETRAWQERAVTSRGGEHGHGGDGLGDACDADDDDDGRSDVEEMQAGSDPRNGKDPDACPDDPLESDAGVCGCGMSDVDSDGDDIADCTDQCPQNPLRFLIPCEEECEAGLCADVDQVCKRCGQPLTDGLVPKASDALGVLRAAVGTIDCAACVCDVNGNGTITATDALATLRRAVGAPVQLQCAGAA
ncbi:MAG TPA: thrombospondin type 3 repeat-containing protein [Candidatus Binatia bacterium]|nr:thrombospondin type 3 repeat-containing protein [Candidatus Binatia bacterium]